MISQSIVQALAVTAEAMGQTLSEGAITMMAMDLDAYPESTVLNALAKCRRECHGKLTLASILDYVHDQDGRPGPEEAWAMLPRSELETVVWTDEMSQAWGTVEKLMTDEISARMAFKEAYQKLTRAARAERRSVKWRVTLGSDPRGRDEPVKQAVMLGRLSPEVAVRLLPHLADGGAPDHKGLARMRGMLAGLPEKV